MLSAENISCIEAEGMRLLDAGRTDPGRAVPQYPGWSLRDLLSHTASVHARTTIICQTHPQERVSAPRLPEGRDEVAWYEETLTTMIAALEASDPGARVWTLGGPTNLWFWERRMVIETGLHRWDAEDAFGEGEPLLDYVARCGLDEFGDMWLQHLGDVPVLQVDAVDLDERWVFGDGSPVRTVSGTASDIYLRLMSRPGASLPVEWEAAVDALAPTPKR